MEEIVEKYKQTALKFFMNDENMSEKEGAGQDGNFEFDNKRSQQEALKSLGPASYIKTL